MPALPRIPLGDLEALAKQFAEAYPALAPRLGAAGVDPDVERVCEAVMLSSAVVIDRTRAYEDAAFASLGDAVCPSVLPPIPAATVLALSAKAPTAVPKGAEAFTRAGYRFRVVRDVAVAPVRAMNARVTNGGLRFEVELVGDLAFVGPLDVFVAGGVDAAARLCVQLDSCRAELVASEWASPVPVRISVDRRAPASDGDVAPHPLLSVRDYFQLASRHLIFRVEGLEALEGKKAVKRAKLCCTLREPVAPISPNALHANGVCATNTFDATIDPAIFNVLRNRAIARIAGFTPEEGRLFAPLEVFAAPRGSRDEPARVPSMTRLGIETVDPKVPFAYGIERDEIGAHFVLAAPTSFEPPATDFVLSARVLATNGARAADLPPATVTVAGPAMNGVEVTNVVGTSWSADAPIGIQRALRVEAFTQLAGAIPFDVSFKCKLSALVPLGETPALVACHRRIAALESLAVVPTVVAHEDTTVRGFEVETGIDESAFEGRGDAELFLRLVHAALVQSMPPLIPVRLVANLRVAGKTLTIGP